MKMSFLVLLLGCSSHASPTDEAADGALLDETSDAALVDGGDTPGDASLVPLQPGDDAGADADIAVDAAGLDGASTSPDGGVTAVFDKTFFVGKWQQTRNYLLDCDNDTPPSYLETLTTNDVEVKNDFSVFLSGGTQWLKPGVFVDEVWYPETINPSGGVAIELHIEGEQLVGTHKIDCGGIPGGHIELVWDRLPL